MKVYAVVRRSGDPFYAPEVISLFASLEDAECEAAKRDYTDPDERPNDDHWVVAYVVN